MRKILSICSYNALRIWNVIYMFFSTHSNNVFFEFVCFLRSLSPQMNLGKPKFGQKQKHLPKSSKTNKFWFFCDSSIKISLAVILKYDCTAVFKKIKQVWIWKKIAFVFLGIFAKKFQTMKNSFVFESLQNKATEKNYLAYIARCRYILPFNL